MKPSLAHFLVKTFVPENGIVLDPFAGVGTIPFEAALQGYKSYGFEISPAARIIASAKIRRPNLSDCQLLLDKLADYLKAQRVSEWKSGDFRSKPLMFVDERQKVDFSVYESIFRQARERLKKDGVFVLHPYNSRKCNMSEQLSKIASRWFRVVDIFSENVQHCESHGIKDKGTLEEHQYLVLS